MSFYFRARSSAFRRSGFITPESRKVKGRKVGKRKEGLYQLSGGEILSGIFKGANREIGVPVECRNFKGRNASGSAALLSGILKGEKRDCTGGVGWRVGLSPFRFAGMPEDQKW